MGIDHDAVIASVPGSRFRARSSQSLVKLR